VKQQDASIANDPVRDPFCHQQSLYSIWFRLRDELKALQDQAPQEKSGHVLNPISGLPYIQNTISAALVFATEYARTRESEWATRACSAVNAVEQGGIYRGLNEPKWNRLGWHYNKGSLFATGTSVDLYWRLLDILGIEQTESSEQISFLLNYLGTCRIRPGLFSHDSVLPGKKSAPVQNIAAITLYILERIAERFSACSHPLLSERKSAWTSLQAGQRPDGFWPYIYPGRLQQIAFKHPHLRAWVSHLPLIRNIFVKRGDSSIFFGDAVHHCLVLYYALKSTHIAQADEGSLSFSRKGWLWVKEHLVKEDGNALRFDFSWEPAPSVFRYGNFCDTSTYFLILASLPYLYQLGLEPEAPSICRDLLLHIERHLLQDQSCLTTIKPYEGPPSVLRWILPRVGEASAWKAALLAGLIKTTPIQDSRTQL